MENVFPLAVFVCVNVSGGELKVTVPKTNDDAFRALVVSIVVVDPSLGAVNGDLTVTFNNVLYGRNGEGDGSTVATVAVNGVECCGIIGRNGIFAYCLGLFGQLKLVGQMSESVGGNAFAKGPNKALGSCAVAVEVVNPEGRSSSAGCGKCIGAASLLAACINVLCGLCNGADVVHAANNKAEAISSFDEFEIAVFILSDVVYNGRAGGAGVDHIVVNGREEVFLQSGHCVVIVALVTILEDYITVRITQIFPYNGRIAVTCESGEVIHEGVTYLNGRFAGVALACNVFRAVLIVGCLAADSVAGVSGSNQLLPYLNALILCALVVQRVLRIGARADSCNGAGDKVRRGGSGIDDRVAVS